MWPFEGCRSLRTSGCANLDVLGLSFLPYWGKCLSQAERAGFSTLNYTGMAVWGADSRNGSAGVSTNRSGWQFKNRMPLLNHVRSGTQLHFIHPHWLEALWVMKGSPVHGAPLPDSPGNFSIGWNFTAGDHLSIKSPIVLFSAGAGARQHRKSH